MDSRVLTGMMLILLSALLLRGFNTPVSASYTSLTGEVEIGAILSLSGDLATFGENHKSAITLADEEVNKFLQAAGANWTLKIVEENDGTDPAYALTKLESLHARGIKFVIGPMFSDAVGNIKEYANAKEILVTSQSSTRPGLNEPNDFLFRFCPNDLVQGPVIARLMTDDNVTKVIAVYRDDAWGKGIHNATKERFEALGGLSLNPSHTTLMHQASRL